MPPSPGSVDIGQSLIGSMGHVWQTGPITVPYTVILLHPSTSTPPSATATPLPVVIMLPDGAAMPLHDADVSHREEYESLSGSKVSGALERLGLKDRDSPLYFFIILK